MVRSKTRLRLFTCALAVLVALLSWARWLEPNLLFVTETSLADARLPQALEGTRVAFIADLHFGAKFGPWQVERLFRKIASLQPDLVLFGGDLLTTEAELAALSPEVCTRLVAAMAALTPPLGKFAVLGNHDLWSETQARAALELLRAGGFTVLRDEVAELAPNFFVAGTAPWPMHARTSPDGRDAEAVAARTPGDAFSLLLAHEPAQALAAHRHAFALQLSGHTHAGQVWLPIVGAPILPHGALGVRAGWTRVEALPVFTTRGVGTSILRLRFCSPPEIAVLTLLRTGTQRPTSASDTRPREGAPSSDGQRRPRSSAGAVSSNRRRRVVSWCSIWCSRRAAAGASGSSSCWNSQMSP